MKRSIRERVSAAGCELPAPNMPAGNFVATVSVGSMLFVAGQGPRLDGRVIYPGQVGRDLTIEQGYEAARLCGLNLLSHLALACDDDLDRLKHVVRIAGVVNSEATFVDHGKVLNGVSDLFFAVLGEKGKHVRMATGAVSLPLNFSVEVEAIFDLAS
jgi:enamine deaminase RidA (YjgF/YER057c/UK114 family)